MSKILLLHKGSLTTHQLYNLYSFHLPNYSIDSHMLYYPYGVKKVKASDKKEFLENLRTKMNNYDLVLCTDADYFKTLGSVAKAEGSLGMIVDSPFTSTKVMYCPSHWLAAIARDKYDFQWDITLEKIKEYFSGSYQQIGTNIIHSESYPSTINDIGNTLTSLMKYPRLYCDIEAFSLHICKAGIGTIGFSWDMHNGVAFAVDLNYPERVEPIRHILKIFFDNYQGELVFHKSNYDVPILIHNLYQKGDITDVKGQLEGLNKFFGKDCLKLHDSLLVTYLATNSCSGNILGLKQLAQPFAGDWAVDVQDITKVPLNELLRYNLIDCLSTAYVYETYYPKMVEDNQEQLYKEHFLPYLKDNMRCQMNGMPIDLNEVHKLEQQLLDEQKQLTDFLNSTQAVKNAEWRIAEKATEKRNSKLKTKVTTVQDNFKPINFNSTQDLITLVYEEMGLPVIEKTPVGIPSTGKKILKSLTNHTNNEEYVNILTALSDLADVEKMLSAFIPTFKASEVDKNGQARQYSSFNLGGTVSGRLSSSGGELGTSNMQQFPSTGSRFAKLVKKCFKPKSSEWLLCGIDFNSLEDYISALQTKDPNKLRVYELGLDGHMFRAISYFNLPFDNLNPEEVNKAKKEYPEQRQLSKAPTFALTYGGSYLTLIKNCGFDETTAKQIEDNYHKLYEVSDKWVAKRIKSAQQLGYVEVAFGLRVRTPVLKQTLGEPKGLAAAEGRTAGNALGQGWGILNDRAMNGVLNSIDSLGLSEDVLPVGKIHDACYYLVRNDTKIITTLNKLCVENAQWQEHPDIWHPTVKLSGQLDLFYPSWADDLTLPEDCTEDQLIQLVKDNL